MVHLQELWHCYPHLVEVVKMTRNLEIVSHFPHSRNNHPSKELQKLKINESNHLFWLNLGNVKTCNGNPQWKLNMKKHNYTFKMQVFKMIKVTKYLIHKRTNHIPLVIDMGKYIIILQNFKSIQVSITKL